jgi:hypothetical protein
MKRLCQFTAILGIFAVSFATASVYGAVSQDKFTVYSAGRAGKDAAKGTDLYVWEKTCVLMEKKDKKTGYYRCAYYMVQDWFGFGYVVLPADTTKNMSGYAGGSVNFWMRSTFDLNKYLNIGIKSGNNEAWVGNIAGYGFVNDGRWCRISIPVKAFNAAGGDSFDLNGINHYFMVKGSGEGMPYLLTLDFCEIYWSKK